MDSLRGILMEKNNKIFLYVILGIIFTALIAVIVALSFILSSFKSMANNNENKNVNAEQNKAIVNSEDIIIFSIDDPITANLMQESANDDKHMLRISVGLALDKTKKDYKKVNEQLSEKLPVLKHIIINVVRNKKYEEVLQPNAQELLGQEILNEINEYFQTDTITDIYFGEFFVQ
jgi:flagellar FliL protein